MKILAINGSHRGSKGSTQFLIDLIAAGASEAGAEFETVVLAKSKMNRCLGCFTCTTEKSFLKCVYDGKDDIKAIHDKMRTADILIYASPIYIFSISSLLKAFLERFMSTAACGQYRVSKSGLFFHDIDKELCSKPFVALICCDNLEDETPRNAISYFRTFSRFMDAPIAGMLVRHTAQGLHATAKEPEMTGNFAHVHDVCSAYHQAGRELATSGRITNRTEKRANQSIIDIPLPILLLMKLNLRVVKQKAVEKAQGLVPAAPKQPMM